MLGKTVKYNGPNIPTIYTSEAGHHFIDIAILLNGQVIITIIIRVEICCIQLACGSFSLYKHYLNLILISKHRKRCLGNAKVAHLLTLSNKRKID